MSTTVFLGGGRITTALLAGLRRSGYRTPIVVHDRHPEKLRDLKRKYGVRAEATLEVAIAHAQSGLLIFAVRPESTLSLATQVAELTANWKTPSSASAQFNTTACSLAAGIPLAQLRAALGPPVRWARAMPSPAARSGRGLTAVSYDRGIAKAGRMRVKGLFARVGPVLEIAEAQFDAFTVTYSCTHGYHALDTLARAAQKAGLDRQTALTAAAHALADGILGWREGDLPLEELLEEAATPGGIAATVMQTMNAHGHPRMVERGLRAGIARARKNFPPRMT
jgi:pyrroline-5-carboxylate reductase